MTRKVYIPGPSVFHLRSKDIFAGYARICFQLKLELLTPSTDQTSSSTAIFYGNVELIDKADGVVADISPFRGPHCDVGTAWEIAYSFARRKPVFAFSNDTRPLSERIASRTSGFDCNGNAIENFGLAENLMIAESLFRRTVFCDFEAAASAATEYFQRSSRYARGS